MNDDTEELDSLSGLRLDGPRVMQNATFINKKLERLLIGPGAPPQATVCVKNCTFLNCSVTGEFRIAPGVELENVIFENVSSSDSLTISTQTVLRDVVVRGSPRSGGLWVKPADFADVVRKSLCEEWASAASRGIACMLDFSEFDAEETEVIGLPLSKLRWNRERHVPVTLEWIVSEEWKRLAFPSSSYWALTMKRLKTFDAIEGVFALPSKKHKRYSQTKDEMNRLIEAGLLSNG